MDKLMKIKKGILTILILASVAASPAIQAQSKLTALEIIKKADEKTRGKTSQGTMSMTIDRPGWSRTIEMKSWSKGTEYSMVYITAPAREKGQVFLKRGNDMWNWVPSIERLIKLPPSMMMQSWMGSDFTNDDLVKESSVVKDYDHKLMGTETVREMSCYKIELIPKPDAPVVWGKIYTWITKDGFDTWQSDFYDEDGYLIHTMYSGNIKQFGDRKIPSEMYIIPKDKKGHRTTLTIKAMEFDKPIDDSFFTQQNMKTIK